MVIIKEISGYGAWWFKTPMDAYKDLQNSFDLDNLPDRDVFIEDMDNGIGVNVEGYEVFSAYDGDQ